MFTERLKGSVVKNVKRKVLNVRRKFYRLKKNGDIYLVIDECLVKTSSTEGWVPGVFYKKEPTSQVFCRTKADFLERFEEVKNEG